MMSELEIGDDGLISARGQDGVLRPVISPWVEEEIGLRVDSLSGKMEIFFGASLGSGLDTIEIHFISLGASRLSTYTSWIISRDTGLPVSQDTHTFDFSSKNFMHNKLDYRTDPGTFASVAVRYLNDLVIYQFIKLVLKSPHAARRFMDSYAPSSHGDSASSSSAVSDSKESALLLILYNHNYSRNIAKLDQIYSGRFKHVYHILPNVCPNHPRCLSFPAGSYQYHLLVYLALRHLQTVITHPNDWALVIQDDVMLHPRIDQASFLGQSFIANSVAAYYYDPSSNRVGNESWPWHKRIVDACLNQRDPLTGNGFEGMNSLYTPNRLLIGVGDFFALKSGGIGDFIELLGFYISQNVFPEASIPTTLKILSSMHGTDVGVMPGIYLWGSERENVNSSEWMENNFYNTDKVFIHPVKASKQGSENSRANPS